MIRTMHTTDPHLPSVTVVVVDHQDYLVIWNAATLADEGFTTRDDQINEALTQAQQLEPPPAGEVIYLADFATWAESVRSEAVLCPQHPSRQERTSTGK